MNSALLLDRKEYTHMHAHTQLHISAVMKSPGVGKPELMLVLDKEYCTSKPQSHQTKHQDSSTNAPTAYVVHFFPFGRCSLVWALQGSVYSFRSFKVNRTDDTEAFLAGSRLVKACCLVALQAENCKSLHKREELELKDHRFQTGNLRCLGLSCT